MKEEFGKRGVFLASAVTAAGAALIGSVYVWAPVCQAMVKLMNGREMPMKCFFSGQALVLIGALLVVNGAMMLFTKKLTHGGAVAAAAGLCAIAVMSGGGLGIGICANVEMACHATAAWAKLCGGVASAAGASAFALGPKAR